MPRHTRRRVTICAFAAAFVCVIQIVLVSRARVAASIGFHDILALRETCAVITTILQVNKAVVHVVEQLHVSLVVIGDRKTNHTEWEEFQRANSEAVVYLSPATQVSLPFRILKHVPWNHFGRKSIGFLYATAGGCQRIYDFDDDNHLKPDGFESLSSWDRFDVDTNDAHVFNPYPYFEPSNDELIWPRGFPLQFIQQKNTYDARSGFVTLRKSIENFDKLAVIQSLADHDPDVDAIYRLTHSLPVNFKRRNTIVIPSRGLHVPWNAQAVIVSRPAFFGLLLPVTVTGRVSDIWRSYITERLLWDTEYKLGFSSSFVTQYRNPHSYMVDFADEDDLYNRVDELLQALASWTSAGHSSLASAYIDLVTKLVEDVHILGEVDLQLAKAWVADLKSVGYVWPPFGSVRMEAKTLLSVPIVDQRHLGDAPNEISDKRSSLERALVTSTTSVNKSTAPTVGGFIVTRNDNYGGDLVQRSTIAIRRMIEVLDEVVIVDMNTAADVLPFITLLPLDVSQASNVKSVIISAEACARELGATCEDKMYEALARNIALRESTTDITVSTNSEIILPSRFTLDEIIQQALPDSNHAVILRRTDISQVQGEAMASTRSKEEAGREGTRIVQTKRVQDLPLGPIGLMDVSIITDCGDFQMARRELWLRTGGFALRHGHNFGDSNLIARWLSAGAAVHLMNTTIFHIRHESKKHGNAATWNPEPRFRVVKDVTGTQRISSSWDDSN